MFNLQSEPMSTITQLFESGLAAPPATPPLDALIREHLELAARDMSLASSEAPPSPPSEHSLPATSDSTSDADLVNEMGDYLIRTAMLWSQLTSNLMKGPHIDRATYEVHERSRMDTHCSDLSAVAAMDVSLGRLRRIRDLTAKFSREVQAIWRPESCMMMGSSPISQNTRLPCYELSSDSISVSGMDDEEPRGQRMRKMTLENANEPRTGTGAGAGGDGSESEESDDDDIEEQFANIDMDALRQRGKGTYYCPKGLRCDKGGVDKDGQLVLFDRNSSFAQHCNKHRKPWRCDLPGCPNPPKKRRFARRDGLERHKATVKHYS